MAKAKYLPQRPLKKKNSKLQALRDKYGPPLNSFHLYRGPDGKKRMLLIQFDGSIHPCILPPELEKLPLGYYSAKDFKFIRKDDRHFPLQKLPRALAEE
jgi:hypothetical protein